MRINPYSTPYSTVYSAMEKGPKAFIMADHEMDVCQSLSRWMQPKERCPS